jgi:NitT/TauT family transport system ATP-binding protein
MSETPRGVSLCLQNVSKHFTDRKIFENVSLTILPGEFVSIVGPSGCGKSTLLRILAGLEPPSTGSVSAIPSPRAGFVFQDPHLLPWRTVARNVALPLELEGKVEAKQRATRVGEVLAQVGLSSDADLYPNQLSGGMKMRVSLARALVMQPDLLLLDEPFAALDELSRVHLEEELRQLWTMRPMTVVLVTHSFSEAVFLANRVLVLSVQQHRVGDSIAVPFGARNEALRRTPQFAGLVQDCRSRFENQQRGE